MKPLRLILASQSPRRAQLLREAGVSVFEVCSPSVEELHDANLTSTELTLENALRKARELAAKHPDALVLAADTLVYVDAEPLAKPASWEEAREMLRRLSGRGHRVCTGVALVWDGGRSEDVFAEETEVHFKPLSEADITAYHAICNPLDKAGGYGIQDGTELILDRLEGSFSNVMGLPMEALLPRLRALTGPGKTHA